MPDGSFRLYNSREGHCKPPSRFRFHGTKEYHILSAGQDSTFLISHVYNETYNRSLGKTNISMNKSKLLQDFARNEFYVPKIVDFTTRRILIYFKVMLWLNCFGIILEFMWLVCDSWLR